MKTFTFKTIWTGLLLAVLLAVFQFAGWTPQMPVAHAQTGLILPNVYQVSALTIGWTAGTVNNGGHAVSVTANSTTSVTSGKPGCTAPSYPECNIVWANSSGTVTVTTSSTGIVTATAAGNSLLALVETNATTVTRIVYPQQMSTAYSVVGGIISADCGTSVNQCGGTYTGTNSLKEYYGTVTFNAGSSTAVVGPFNPTFTTDTPSTKTYSCTVTRRATTVGLGTSYTQEASSITIFAEGNAVVAYRCSGY